MPRKKSVSLNQAEANAAAVRRLWRQGRVSQRRIDKIAADDPDAVLYGRCAETYQAEAKILGMDIGLAAQARRIASDFSEERISQICKSIVERRAPFSSSHLLTALRVPAGKERDDLIRRAIKERWTALMMRRAIQAMHGGPRRPGGGRKPHVPTDPGEALIALGEVANKFLRLASNETIRLHLARDIVPLVDKAIVDIEKVKTAIDKRLKR